MCQQLGLFHKHDSYCVDEFILAIPKEILHFNFNLNTHNSSTISVLKSNVNYLLLLDKDIEELRANYSKSHLKNLRRANKNNLSIATVPDSAEQFSKNKRLLASSFMKAKQFDLELKIINTSLKIGKGEIFSVEGSQGNCCSVFVINDNKRLYLLSSYTNEEGKQKSAYFFLLDYIFSLEKFRGFIFDFEGSNLDGIAQRNKGFGAKPTTYFTIYQSLWSSCLKLIGVIK